MKETKIATDKLFEPESKRALLDGEIEITKKEWDNRYNIGVEDGN